MDREIQVAEYHVAKGRRENFCLCPVALAIAVVLPAGWTVKVYGYNVRIWNGKSAIELDLPGEVVNRIGIFDHGGGMEPFKFTLWIPDIMFEEVAR